MKQKIKIPIKNKIISKQNIKDIAEYVYSLKQDGDRFSLTIVFNNNMEISSEDLSCINSRKIEEYEIDEIRISYRDRNYLEEIDVDIRNYDQYEYSNIEISSNDENKLATVEHKLNELLGYCEKQSKISFLNKGIFLGPIIMGILIGVSGFLMLKFVNNFIELNTVISILVSSIIAIMYYIGYNTILKAYPNIEINISDKTNKSKQKRKIIIWVITVMILPMLLNVIYDILKYIIMK